MNLNIIDDDSEESDFLSIAGEDVEVNLNHYRVPKLLNYGPFSINSPPKSRRNREQVKFSKEGKIMSLTELAAQKVACHLPFGLVEHFEPPVPEPMQCRIAYWSFPQDEEDVKLYTCLANGSADYFYRAEELINHAAVRDMLQVGFHLSANVQFMSENESLEFFRVAVTFDRRRITSCSCTCLTSTFWCQHVVAVCLQRIRNPQEVKIRAPVSESLQRLEKNQLQKFAQYLINELPQQILPAAQKLLDELLSGEEASINLNPAAPDPTAGATMHEQTNWCLDYSRLGYDIHRILLKQCTAQPTVCSDIQSLHVTAPPATTEYTQLLRPIRGREPEGMYNLISIIGEMMKRRDPNLFLLLDIMTEEVMKFDKIVTWWFEAKVSMHSGSSIHFAGVKNSQCTSQYSCSNFCDEIVHLWRLAALNPAASQMDRQKLSRKFFEWHLAILKKHRSIAESSNFAGTGANPTHASKRNLLELFPGFKPALEGCHIEWPDWDDKQAKLIGPKSSDGDLDDDKENGKGKPAKSGKRRRRRPKSMRHNLLAGADAKLADDKRPANSDTIPKNIESNDQVDASDSNVAEAPPNAQEQQQQQQPETDRASGASTPRPPGLAEQNNPNDAADALENDLQVYFMDNPPDAPQGIVEPESLDELIEVNMKRVADPLEIMYAKTEGLYAHGHLEEAKKIARALANEILSQPNYPSHKQFFTMAKKRRKKGSQDNQMSIVLSETLTKINFLCNVLMDEPENHGLIFKLVMFGVELKRAPAATRPLEVKLISQKQELIFLLRSIILHDTEFDYIRKKAKAIRDRGDDSPMDALTTLIFGDSIFDALILSHYPKQLEDDNLGFQCALSALGVKANVVESDHSLLCEGIRRQRGELALSLMTHYKDDQEKLDAILKQLLDEELLLSVAPVVRERTLSTNSNGVLAPNVPVNGIKKSPAQQQDMNQPSEAASHFMFELAKTVYDKAGGNNNTAHMFRPQLVAQNGGRIIHRKLHMCSLRIALYALGLQNRTSPNWMQRTYNGRASYINDQALELGLPGIKFLCENWEGFLTPSEAASLAEKARCANDAETKRIAAELAKSCLKYINYLDCQTVTRILGQCKEQAVEMIEEACSEIEQLAEDENVCADLLFATARAWHGLYLDLITDERHSANGNLYQLTSSEQQDTSGAADWFKTSGQVVAHFDPHTGQHQHVPPAEAVLGPPKWDVYAEASFIATADTPIYKNFDYVRAAFRVGIKALSSIKLSLHVGSKHNSKKLDEILWLFGISKSLGRECILTFSSTFVQNKNITDPYTLHVIILEISKFFTYINLPQAHRDRVTLIEPIYQKCLDCCWRQTKDSLKLGALDQKCYIETILDVVKTLTEESKTMTTARSYLAILSYLEHKMDKRSHRRINYINLNVRRAWLQEFAKTLGCVCDQCWPNRDLTTHRPLPYQMNSNTNNSNQTQQYLRPQPNEFHN